MVGLRRLGSPTVTGVESGLSEVATLRATLLRKSWSSAAVCSGPLVLQWSVVVVDCGSRLAGVLTTLCLFLSVQTKSGKSIFLDDYVLVAEPQARANSFVGTEVGDQTSATQYTYTAAAAGGRLSTHACRRAHVQTTFAMSSVSRLVSHR